MATDDERRRVAERLRMSDERDAAGFDCLLAEVVRGREFCETPCEHCHGRLLDELADLIEPASTSSDSAPTSDPTERGIDSIYDWCFESLEGADGAEDYLYCSIMSAIEEYRHPESVTARTARPVDRGALLALADEIDCPGKFDMQASAEAIGMRLVRQDIARRVREACGEEVA